MYNFSLDTDKIFICDKHMQRLIFYSGEHWEDWEQHHIDNFKEFLMNEGLSIPASYREEEMLRIIHAS
jgi:hypothetical protein